MARQRKRGPVQEWGLGRQVWDRTDVSGWLEILREADPSREWRRNGNTISCTCPYHEEKTPSFKLTVSKRVGKCFGGGCGKTVTDIVQLVAKLRNCTYEAALIFLNDKLQLDQHFGKEMGKLTEHHSLEEMKKAAAVAFTKVVDEFVRDRPANLDYMRVAAAYLEKGRGVPVHMLCNLPVSIFPKPEHAKKYMPAEFHEAYDKYFKAVNAQAHWGCPVFWYNDSPSTISKFKLRNKAPDLKVRLAGVQNVEDLPQQAARGLFEKAYTVVDDPIQRPMGFFGLHHYSRLLSDQNTSVVVTEGEFDALSVMVGQLKNGSTMDFPILATGGTGTSNFDLLKDFWIKTVYAVPDAPGDKRGDQLAYTWLTCNSNVNGALNDTSLLFKIFMWPASLTKDSGDLDDAVRNHGYDFVKRELWTEKENSYLNRADWVTRKCDAEIEAAIAAFQEEKRKLEAVDDKDKRETAVMNLEADNQRKLRSVLGKWNRALADRMDRSVFTSSFSAKLGLDLTSLDEVYTSLNDVNTMLGAVEVVTKALFNIVSFPYYTLRNGKMHYNVYSKVTEEVMETPFSQDNGVEQAISKFVSNDMTNWMKMLLRNAVTTTPREDELEKYNSPNAVRAEEQKRCAIVMRQVITTNAHKCPDVATLYKIGQGIHYRDLPGNADTVYFVNGMKVFKGKINPESGAPIDWEQIHDLRDGNYWFDCARSMEWSQTVQDVQDLNFGMQVDLAKVYSQVVSVLDGWEFQDHSIMRRFIAAWIMSIPIQLAIDRVTITCITGESTSGKTSFLQGLLGGSRSSTSRIPSILEPAKVVTDATEAYLNQTFDRTSMFVGIDEAETDDNAEHNKRMKSLIRMLYSVSTGGGDIGRGSPNHVAPVEMKYKCPTILAAIHLPTDETFLTRTTILYTKKNYKWKDIGDYINSVLKTGHELNELRRSITTGLLSRLDEVRERADKIVALARLEETDPPTTDRFRESVSVALAVYEMSGTADDPHDPIELYHSIVKANKPRLEILLAADMKHQLLDTILFSRCIPAYRMQGGPLESMSPRDLLVEGSRDDIDTLNNARIGVYCIPDKGWLVLYWRQLKATVLASHPTYRELAEGALRESISKNKYLVTEISDADHKYIMNKIRIADAKMQAAYSVLSVKYLLDSDYETTVACKPSDSDAKSAPSDPFGKEMGSESYLDGMDDVNF